jgi:AraC-like DNA-binding protein
MTFLRGDGWLGHEDTPPQRLGTGDVAIVRGPDPYVVSDDPDREPLFTIMANGRCVAADGSDLHLDLALDVRTHGPSPTGSVAILSGTYQVHGNVSRRLLTALPRVLIVPANEARNSAVSLLHEEMLRDEPGQQAVLDRLLDLALLITLRSWFEPESAHRPRWYEAQADPVVGPALGLVHDNPAHPWTVAEIANRVGVSRAALARRFHDLVGEPPMAYLSQWRMALTADLLRTGDATLEAIARQVGYANAFALSAAFKRLNGVSPSQYRQQFDAGSVVGVLGPA